MNIERYLYRKMSTFENMNRYEVERLVSRDERFPPEKNSKLYCLMLTLIIMCGSGVLIAVLVAGIIYAVQQAS